MLSVEQLFPFLLTAVFLTATPGPDNLMVLSVGASKGRRLGMAFGLGCACGCLSHTVLAALGVSALLAASPVAFMALRVIGGGYLVWLGIGALRSSNSLGVPAACDNAAAGPSDSAKRQFFKGVLANAINPKVVLFFLSFLPQFVLPGKGNVPLQMAVLGVVFTLQAAAMFSALGWFAGGIGQWLQRRPRAGLWLDRLSGVIFVGLGLRMSLVR